MFAHWNEVIYGLNGAAIIKEEQKCMKARRLMRQCVRRSSMVPRTLEKVTSGLSGGAASMPISTNAVRRHSWQTPDCHSYFIPRSVRILGLFSPDTTI